MTARYLCSALLVCLAGCGVPKSVLCPYKPAEPRFLTVAERRRAAPLILVVKILSTELTSERAPDPSGSGRLRLAKTHASVENVIQGSLKESDVSFAFFTTLSEPGVHGGPYWFEPGQRWIVFLRQECGTLRTITDTPGMDIRVRTGRHDTRDFPEGSDPNMAIGYILLTPGVDIRPGDVYVDTERVWGTVPERFFLAKVNLFLKSSDKRFREGGCVDIAVHYGLDADCLASVPPESVGGRLNYERIQYTVASKTASFPGLIKRDPLFLANISPTVDDVVALLELYASWGPPKVKASACGVLNRLDRKFQPCLR